MFGLGTGEIIAIVLVIVLLFGATRLPQLAKSIGQSRKALRDAMRESEEEEKPDVQKPQIETSPAAVDVASMSDEEIASEMRRRVSTK